MRVCIDAGHGGHDPGGVFEGLHEKNITLDIATRLNSLLGPSIIETVLTRSKDNFLSLRERVDIANKAKADYFLSIHTNADPDDDDDDDPEAEGQEVWINPGSAGGTKFAQHLGEGLQVEFPDEPWRGLKERGLYVVRNTVMPAALVEVGFIDHSDTNRELQQPAVRKRIAFALLRGIVALREET